MTEKVSLTLPTVPDLTLRLNKSSLTFYSDYAWRSVLNTRSIAQIGFDLCGCIIDSMQEGTESCFEAISGIALCQERISASKYAAVEAKVFSIINESCAIYSLGVLLRDLLISTGHSDIRLRTILDKACDKYSFGRHQSFRELREDFAIYLKNNVDEETYGVIITERSAPTERVSSRAAIAIRDEPVHFQQYTSTDRIKRRLTRTLAPERIKAMLAVAFILFSSITIPITSVNKKVDPPTMAHSQAEK